MLPESEDSKFYPRIGHEQFIGLTVVYMHFSVPELNQN